MHKKGPNEQLDISIRLQDMQFLKSLPFQVIQIFRNKSDRNWKNY